MSTAIRILQGSFGRVALLDMDGPLVTHAHHHCHILLKASGADSAFVVRDGLQTLTERTAVLVNAWEPHAYAPAGNLLAGTVILALYLDCAWLAGIHRQLSVAGHPHFFPHSCVEIGAAIRERADSLALEMADGSGIAPERLETRLSDLLLAVLEPFSEMRNARRLAHSAPLSTQDRRIRRAVDLLQQGALSARNMHALAARSGLSRAHFFALFRQCMNMPPAVYANTLRMEAAIDGLGAGPVPIADLSDRLGFAAQSHFTRFFRHHLGITPSEYRRKTNVLGRA